MCCNSNNKSVSQVEGRRVPPKRKPRTIVKREVVPSMDSITIYGYTFPRCTTTDRHCCRYIHSWEIWLLTPVTFLNMRPGQPLHWPALNSLVAFGRCEGANVRAGAGGIPHKESATPLWYQRDSIGRAFTIRVEKTSWLQSGWQVCYSYCIYGGQYHWQQHGHGVGLRSICSWGHG